MHATNYATRDYSNDFHRATFPMPQHTREDPFDSDVAIETEDDFEPDFGFLGDTDVELSLPEADLRFIRDFILGSAAYVEELENTVCDRSDEYWEAREHAYRIITGLLIELYKYEMAE